MIVNPILYQQGTKLPELENPGTASDLLAGKQLVDQYGNPLTGTMPEVTQAVPSISVSDSGLITASVAQDAGHVVAGTKSATKQLATQAGKTVTPTTYAQTAVASGRYTTGAVNVTGDANLKAENIKSGVSIFGVSGGLSLEPKWLPLSVSMVSINSAGIHMKTGLKNCKILTIAADIRYTTNGQLRSQTLCGPAMESNEDNSMWIFIAGAVTGMYRMTFDVDGSTTLNPIVFDVTSGSVNNVEGMIGYM